MQTTKRIYLDLDSTYRDRTLWPSPGEFEVLLTHGPGGTKNILDARDPVALSAPLLAWTSNRFQADLASSTSVVGTVLGGPGLGSANSLRVVVFTTPVGQLQQAPGYYCTAVLETAAAKVKVISYLYLGTRAGGTLDVGKVVVDADVTLAAGDTVELLDPSDLSDPLAGRLFIPSAEHRSNNYFGMQIYNETVGDSRTITFLDSSTGTILIGPPAVPTWTTAHNYSVRTQPPYDTYLAGGGSTAGTVVLPGGPPQDNIFSGWFIRVLQTVYANASVAPQGEIRRVTSYLGGATLATVHPPFSASPAGLSVEVLPYSYDNATRVTYMGTLEQELVPYQIRLMSAILPNQLLASKDGSRIAFYPYVYVELSTLDGTPSNLIMSNNFNAVKALFKVPIDNIEDLLASTFITCETEDMTQVIRFKADTNFRVKVLLPDGEVFNTTEPERFSPNEPNPLGQLSLQFELIRFC